MHPENLHTVICGAKIDIGCMPVQTYPICPEPIQFMLSMHVYKCVLCSEKHITSMHHIFICIIYFVHNVLMFCMHNLTSMI